MDALSINLYVLFYLCICLSQKFTSLTMKLFTACSAATSDAQYSGAAVQPYAAAGSSQGLVIPTWPGQMPPLVDVFGYQEVPGKLLDSIVNALPGMEAAARQLHSVQLGCSEGEKQGREEGGVVMSCEDLRGLRETLHTYQHVNWVYDRVS